MSTTRTSATQRTQRSVQRYDHLPALTTSDRLALRLGLALVLWAQRREEHAARLLRTDRAEQSRRSGAAHRAAADRDRVFEHRQHAGPTW